MQSLSAAAGEPEHHHRHHRHRWHEDHEGHQSLAGDQGPGSVHLHPAPSVGRDWRHVSSARPGPPPGAWCRPRRGHGSGLLHGSREQSPAAVTSNQGGEGKVGGYPLLTGHEDLSKTLVFHVFVRMTARYTGLPSAKVGCLSYVRGCWPAPPRPAPRGVASIYTKVLHSDIFWVAVHHTAAAAWPQYTAGSLCSAGSR